MDSGGGLIEGAHDQEEKRSYRVGVDRLASAQKPGWGVPAYLRWVNRALGRRAAAAAWVLGLSPNIVTAMSAALSVGAFVLIAAGGSSIWAAVSAAFLLLAGYALDSADGQLARLLGGGSPAGEWLDHVVDAARLPLLHLAIGIHLIQIDDYRWLTVVAMAFLILSSVWFFSQTLAEKLGISDGSTSLAPAWVSFAKLPYDVGTLYLTVFFLAALPVFAALYLALFAATAVIASLSFRRKYRALCTLAASASAR